MRERERERERKRELILVLNMKHGSTSELFYIVCVESSSNPQYLQFILIDSTYCDCEANVYKEWINEQYVGIKNKVECNTLLKESAPWFLIKILGNITYNVLMLQQSPNPLIQEKTRYKISIHHDTIL